MAFPPQHDFTVLTEEQDHKRSSLNPGSSLPRTDKTLWPLIFHLFHFPNIVVEISCGFSFILPTTTTKKMVLLK